MFRLSRSYAINGWMAEAELRFLAEMASERKVIFEIGSYQGKSTRVMADNSTDTSVIYAIDSWDYYITTIIKSDFVTYNQFLCNLYDHILSGKVIPCVSSWKDYIPKIRGKADFIFIDGDHIYNSVKHDINKALEWLSDDGIIAGHDYDEPFPGVVKAVHERFSKFNLTETIWWTQKS